MPVCFVFQNCTCLMLKTFSWYSLNILHYWWSNGCLQDCLSNLSIHILPFLSLTVFLQWNLIHHPKWFSTLRHRTVITLSHFLMRLGKCTYPLTGKAAVQKSYFHWKCHSRRHTWIGITECSLSAFVFITRNNTTSYLMHYYTCKITTFRQDGQNSQKNYSFFHFKQRLLLSLAIELRVKKEKS